MKAKCIFAVNAIYSFMIRIAVDGSRQLASRYVTGCRATRRSKVLEMTLTVYYSTAVNSIPLLARYIH